MVPLSVCLSWIHFLQCIFSLHLAFLCCIIQADHSFRDWLSHPIPIKHFQLISLQHTGGHFVISSTCTELIAPSGANSSMELLATGVILSSLVFLSNLLCSTFHGISKLYNYTSKTVPGH